MKCDRSLYDLACIVHVYEYCFVVYTVYMILHIYVGTGIIILIASFLE